MKIVEINDNPVEGLLIHTITDLPKDGVVKLASSVGLEVEVAGNVIMVHKVKDEAQNALNQQGKCLTCAYG
jgi:hypothetical protein